MSHTSTVSLTHYTFMFPIPKLGGERRSERARRERNSVFEGERGEKALRCSLP